MKIRRGSLSADNLATPLGVGVNSRREEAKPDEVKGSATGRYNFRTFVATTVLGTMFGRLINLDCSFLPAFEQKLIQIEWLSAHCQIAISVARPLFPRPIPVQLHTVSIRVAKVNCLTHSVI